MLNVQNAEPLTAAEIFLLMRLLQHLKNTEALPEEHGVDKDTWQTIYSKLNHTCLAARTKPTRPLVPS